jgi:hypothetical protein
LYQRRNTLSSQLMHGNARFLYIASAIKDIKVARNELRPDEQFSFDSIDMLSVFVIAQIIAVITIAIHMPSLR